MTSEIGDFVAPSPHACTDARVEPARRRCVEGRTQVADRCRQIPGEPGAEGEARQVADPDRQTERQMMERLRAIGRQEKQIPERRAG